MPGYLYLKTFGCQMNEYDSARMADVLRAAEGLELTEDPARADVVLLNTCSIREKAEDKVYSHLGVYAELKRKRPGVIIGVGGCVASQEGEGILARAPFVDVVFGPQTLHRLPELLGEVRRSGRPQVDVSFPANEKFDELPLPAASAATAFVSVMEGCSKYCSFCVVPYTRGEEISRPFAQVLAEVRALAAQGVREVTLLGQNVNAYDGALEDGDSADLALLIEHVAAIDGIARIRFTTSHPLEFTDRLIEAYARVPALVNHLHLPVQSGSDRILAAMKRGYTALEYKQKIRRLHACAARHRGHFGLHRRLPGRDRPRLRGDPRPDRRGRLRPVVQLHLQPPARHAGRGAPRRGARGRQAAAARDPAGAPERAGRGAQPGPRRHRACRCSSSGRRAATAASLPGGPSATAGSISKDQPR